MNRPDIDRIVEKIIGYANLQDGVDMSKKMWRLWKYCFDRGVSFSWHGRRDREVIGSPDNYLQARELAIRNSLREVLDTLIAGGKVDISFYGEVSGAVGSGGPAGLWLRLSDNDGDIYILAKLMVHLLLFSGVKEVKRCLGCGDYILLKKNNGKETCGTTCKQIVYQRGLSKERRHKQRKKRSAAYYRKKMEKINA